MHICYTQDYISKDFYDERVLGGTRIVIPDNFDLFIFIMDMIFLLLEMLSA